MKYYLSGGLNVKMANPDVRLEVPKLKQNLNEFFYTVMYN